MVLTVCLQTQLLTYWNLLGKTHRVSYHGDVGLHVGKACIVYLSFVEGDPSKLDTIPVNERNRFMSQMYAPYDRKYIKMTIRPRKRLTGWPNSRLYLTTLFIRRSMKLVGKWSFEQIDDLVARLWKQTNRKTLSESQADNLGVEDC